MLNKDLVIPSKINELVEIIDELMLHNDMLQLKNYAHEIEKRIQMSNTDRDTKQALGIQLVRCQLMSIPMASFQVLKQLCMSQVLLAASIKNFDWKEKLDGYFVTIPSLEERDRLKKQLVLAFSQNQEILSKNENIPVTIGQWVTVFVNQIKTSGDNALELLNITKDEKFRQLNNDNKSVLNNIFSVVNYLHRSSVKMESDTESITFDTGVDGELLEFRSGNFYTVIEAKTEEKRSKNSDKVTDVNPIDIGTLNQELQREDRQALSRLFEKSGDVNEFVKKLSSSLLAKNISETLAILLALARKGNVLLLFNNPSLSKLLTAYKINNTIRDLHESNQNSDSGFSENLYVILVGYLGFSKSEAAHIASDLIAIAREKGEKIDHVSYYDEADGQYHWL